MPEPKDPKEALLFHTLEAEKLRTAAQEILDDFALHVCPLSSPAAQTPKVSIPVRPRVRATPAPSKTPQDELERLTGALQKLLAGAEDFLSASQLSLQCLEGGFQTTMDPVAMAHAVREALQILQTKGDLETRMDGEVGRLYRVKR